MALRIGSSERPAVEIILRKARILEADTSTMLLQKVSIALLCTVRGDRVDINGYGVSRVSDVISKQLLGKIRLHVIGINSISLIGGMHTVGNVLSPDRVRVVCIT